MENRTLLIISYTFPPHPGIGGRRWAKFAKYLALNGYKVHVICAENITNANSLWTNDVLHENIITHTLPVKYPKGLIKTGNDFLSKVKFRFWKIILTFFSAGTVFERTLFWKKQLLKRSIEIIDKNNIKNVVITIPPYRLAYYGVSLKKIRPEINLIADYRDPWTNNLSFHGFKDLSQKRLAFEKKMELEVLNSYDKIVTVAENTTNYLKGQLNKAGGKFYTIPNGFDPNDIKGFPIEKNSKKITFIHTGTVYSNLEYIIKPLLSFLVKLKQENNSLYEKLSFEFYGNYGFDLKKEVEENKLTCFSINTPVSLPEAFKKIINSDYCLLFAAPDHGFAFNTKFCEYVGNRKPIILFSNIGDASQFIEVNKIGKCIYPNSLDKDMMTLFNAIETGSFVFNTTFNVHDFSVEKLTDQYQKLFV
jgi:glycosyltransferase involved in cell wall biosynthesis